VRRLLFAEAGIEAALASAERLKDKAEQGINMEQSASPEMVSPYLTAPEAALYIRTTIQGIYSLVKRRKVRSMPGRPGRLLFTREALDSYLNGRPRH